MTARIRQIHKDSYETYRMSQVCAEFIEQGVCISRQRASWSTPSVDSQYKALCSVADYFSCPLPQAILHDPTC
ncbi:MAG: hypothetical protein U1E12_16370 [Hydrogenophaga sp.]|jgi:hypothetical protein|uniref:hypothetical protein n=1 Tax=unclassified Hydrogenophaga TaxID=2610897 RepID=UPI0010F8CFE0|nr:MULTISPECIES: hypothetical protein [unclassified Hydrogenophaga]MDP3811708.1 hypothetical protein [Hydrogenophaga sp.]MDZ4103244.1 hypothetical protein [Hydrogenophaga sp.]MDZ4279629.1 hypothetical protein [Hydrogenophaga sp.]